MANQRFNTDGLSSNMSKSIAHSPPPVKRQSLDAIEINQKVVSMEILLGGLITIFVAIFIEHYRRPKLRINITEPIDQTYTSHPAQNARFLLLQIENVKPILKFLSRNPALQCHGLISFHHLDDGQNYFGRTMRLRWSGSPEPLPLTVEINNQIGRIYDPLRFSLDSFVDIHTGESWNSDVAAKFDADDECYGWTNENYFSDPIWRNPAWGLPKGRYLVNVEIITSGNKISRLFRLINDVKINDFRLEPALKQDGITKKY